MIRRIFIYAIFIAYFTLNTSAYAQTAMEINCIPIERVYSSKKAIDSISKIENKEVSIVNNFNNMFLDAEVSGQVKIMYGDYNYKNKNDTYATAIGGIIKYELASLNGFNVGGAIYTSRDVSFATGTGINHNSEASSQSGSYTEIAEAYINYKYKDFNFRAGRQLLATPLADNDDQRMIQNTFEAYVATFNINGFEIMAGSIQNWQGFDAGLETPWAKTGENGTYFGGVTYDDGVALNLWYYNITGNTNAFYFDGGFEYSLSEDIVLYTVVQFLDESELSQSGTEATIYGGLLELTVYGIGFNIAYDKALINKNKSSFTGTGGGALFTNMDTIGLDNVANNSDAEAIVCGIVYSVNDFEFLYAYGDFLSESEHVKEQNIGMEYNLNDEFLVTGVYVMQEDLKQDTKTDFDFDRFQLIVNYNF